MDIQISEQVIRIHVIKMNGRLDAFSVKALRSKLDELTRQGGIHFVLDLADVSFMDSAGLAAMVSLLRQVQPLGGTVKLVRATEANANRVLTLTKMDRAFPIFDNSAAALAVV
jgi:anti-sigma B factor antagonist